MTEQEAKILAKSKARVLNSLGLLFINPKEGNFRVLALTESDLQNAVETVFGLLDKVAITDYSVRVYFSVLECL